MKTITHRRREGLTALIAVNLIALGTLAFLMVTAGAAVTFADMVHKKELRMQAALNVRACLDSLALMAAKDYFLNGQVSLREFGCTADVSNDFRGNVSFGAAAVLSGVSARDSRAVRL
ncbi:MAG: hypothetical protein QOG91_692 [Candidatus Parcubacteria bacterium]|jgi:hypothetical protein|nr:hypothetical protein [Candidatus Parcubacteria bacterium]